MPIDRVAVFWLLPTFVRYDDPVIFDAWHNSIDWSSNFYRTAAHATQRTWVPESRRSSSAPETPHSLYLSGLCFTAWAVDIILDCTPTACTCCGFNLVDVHFPASGLVPWSVLLLWFFLRAWSHDRTCCKSTPSQTRWKSFRLPFTANRAFLGITRDGDRSIS